MGMHAAIATVAATGGISPHFHLAQVYYFTDISVRLLVFFANYSFVAFCNIKSTVNLLFTEVQEQKDKLSVCNKMSN